MNKKIIMILFLIFCVVENYPIFANTQPILVFSSLRLEVNNSGKLVPEISVNSDGTWRKATLKDVLAGQEFSIYNRVKNPILRGNVIVNSIRGNFLVGCDAKESINKSSMYWGIYKAKQNFVNVGQGEKLKPKYTVNEIAEKMLFDKNTDIKKRLQDLIKQDWDNIQNQFPKLHTSNISDFMIGDINGDNYDDYVIILSDVQHVKKEAVLVYLTNGKNLTMLPLSYREFKDYVNWYMLSLMIDFNGDGAEEFMILDADGDTCCPIIYGWNKDKQALMTLYEGDELYTW